MAIQDKTYSDIGGRQKPETNRSAALWWRYMRLSGVLLVPLIFGHLAIVHLINSVADINHEWVITQRWSFVGWRLYDAGMLWFAALHGFRGLKYVIDDYVHSETWNRILTIAMIILAIGLLAVGTIALIATPYS